MFKVWISHDDDNDEEFTLHYREPKWDSLFEVWGSVGMTYICIKAARKLLGDRAPEKGELVELDVKYKETWVSDTTG